MKVSQAFPSKYMKADDLDGDVTVTISGVESETLGSGADADVRPVIYFEETEKGVVLNKTNATTISGMYGDDTDDWTGKPITLFATEVDFQGKQTLAIRVRMKKPANATSTKKPSGGKAGAWAAFSDKVKSFNNDNPDDAYNAEKAKTVFTTICGEVFPDKDPKTFSDREWSIVAERVTEQFEPAAAGLVPF